MTIRHLKIFITVADCGKMRKAAEILYVSQPSISQAIKDLEDYYNVKLFERLSQKIYLTEEGNKLLSYARHIVDSYEKMDLAMKSSRLCPIIRLGASVSVGTCLLNTVLSSIESNTIDIRVVVNNTEYIEKKILRNELDIGIVEGIVNSQDLIKIPIFDDELVVVVGKNHPLYSEKIVTLDKLNNQDFISREDGSTERNQYEKILANNNIKLVPKWTSTNTEAIKQAVINGRGLAIMSRMLINNEVKDKKIKVLKIKDIKVTREVILIYHKHKYISSQLNTLISTAKNLKDIIQQCT